MLEVNLQKCSLIFRRIRHEDDCPDYITKLLPRNSDLRSDSRASRYGRFDLVCPFYNKETENVGGGGGDVLLKFVELSCGIGFLLICERRTPLASLRMLLKNIFSQALMGIRRTPLASLRMLLRIFLT